jgi:PAS domain S-box-containing protein
MDDHKVDKAEKAIAISHEDWESMFNTVTDCVTVHDLDFNIVRMNQSAREMLGLQRQDPIPSVKCFQCYHGTDKPPSDCASCQSLMTGRSSTVEIFEPFLNKHVEIRALPRFRDDGQLAGLIHIVRDITERKWAEEALQQAKDVLEHRVEVRTAEVSRVNEELRKEITERRRTEEELRESEAKYRSLASVADRSFVIGRDCRYLFANENYLNLFGLESDSVIGRKYDEFHDLERARAMADNVKYVFDTGNVCQSEHRGARTGLHFLQKFSPISNIDGSIYAVTVMSIDITERKLAEEALKKSEGRLRFIYEKSPIALGFIDQAGSLVDFNDAHVKMIGSPREKLIGFNMQADITNPGLKAALKVAFSGGMGTFEGKYKTVIGGNTLYLRTFFVPLFDDNGLIQGVQFLAEDITERKQFEEDLRQYTDKLEKLVRERTTELEMRNKSLEEMNTALNVLLQKREEDKRRVEEVIVSNIKSLVYPYIEKMQNDSPNAKQHLLLSIIETHLNELLSPLLKTLQQFNLTPKEVQVAAMVKDGKTTKEIAAILGVETSSIDAHRNSVRKKLGLSRNANLQSKLQSFH